MGLGHAGQEQCDVDDVHLDETVPRKLDLGEIGSLSTTDENV